MAALGDIASAPAQRAGIVASLRAFKGLLDGDVYSAIHFPPATQDVAIFHEQAGWLPDAHPGVQLVRETHFRHPLMMHFRTVRRSVAECRSNLVPNRIWRRSDLGAIERQMGFKDCTGVCLHTRGGGVLLLTCSRSRNFAPKEVELARQFQRVLQGMPLFSTQDDVFSDTKRAMPCGLSAREQEILRWVREGKTNNVIATILGISSHTVRKHLEHIFAKLGVETRTGAVCEWERVREENGVTRAEWPS